MKDGDRGGAPASKPPSQQTAAPPPSPKPPRGPRVWIALVVIGAIAAGFGAGAFWGPAVKPRAAEIAAAPGAGETASDDHTARFYTCGMHPWVILPEPGPCPICRMELTPLDPDKFTGEITIDPVVTQNIGVRVGPVTSGPVVRTIRTVGTVAYDETRVRDVNIKAPGWIETLYVDYEGAKVAAGDPLFEFYSPKLYSAQSEYLTALHMRGTMGGEAQRDIGMDNERLIADARVQLEYLDVTPEQIAALEASGEPAKTMTIRSAHTGIVIAKHANEGMRVDTGMRVYQIADLSTVWVMVSLYEYQLPFVQLGQQASMSLPYIPGQPFEGRVIYVYPYLDEKTRQVSVRLEFENPGLLLKPGMYASIELRSTLARERTLAPRSAVIDTGERQVAFVSLGEGRFEPREVRMGVETQGGLVEILDGLSPGEMVVTSGQFLLDSESRIRESLAKMIRGRLASEQPAVAEVAGASELASLPPALSAEITTALERYFEVGGLLAADKTAGVADPARGVAGAVDDLLKMQVPGDPHFWHRHDEIATVRGKALEIAGAPDIETARLAFADLSVALVKLVRATGVPPAFGAEVQELHCPMYREGQGGSIWLQPAGNVRNPFFGAVMLGCFDRRTVLPVTGRREEGDGDGAEPPPAEPAPHGAAPAGGSTSAEPVAPAADAPGSPGPEAQTAIDELFGAYLALHDKLTQDDLDGAAGLLDDMHDAASRVESSAPPAVATIAGRWRAVPRPDPASLTAFRQGFRGLSDATIALARAAPPSGDVAPAVYHVYCPMEKASWLQAGREVENPYAPFMLRCGKIKEEFEARVAKGEAP